MKKNSFITFLIGIFLLLAVYKFFTGNYLGNDIGFIPPFINNDDKNSNDSTDNSTPTKLNFTINGINFQRETSFDFFNPQRCDSYENFTFLGCSTQYGSYYKSENYVEMNGFPCYVVLPTDSITSLDDLLNIENLNWEIGPVSSSLTIFNISNPKYDLSNYFISCAHIGTDSLLFDCIKIDWGNKSELPSYDIVIDRCNDLGVISSDEGYNSYTISILNPEIVSSEDESLLYNLSSPLDYYQDYDTEPANYLIKKNTDDNESTTVEKWIVEDEYVPTFEEDDYSCGENICSNSDGLTNEGPNEEKGWSELYG